jgi:hypothetical protein
MIAKVLTPKMIARLVADTIVGTLVTFAAVSLKIRIDPTLTDLWLWDKLAAAIWYEAVGVGLVAVIAAGVWAGNSASMRGK